MKLTTLLIIASLLVAIGRFTIPGHPLTGWPGTYEAFAHIWMGFLIAVACIDTTSRKNALILLGALSALEVVKFLVH